MVLVPSVAGLFKWRQFEPEVILLAVGWYPRFNAISLFWEFNAPKERQALFNAFQRLSSGPLPV